MEQPEELNQTLPGAVPRLIFALSDGLQQANDALLGLREYKVFAHQVRCLTEDAEQLRELRGDMLDYILETWRSVETEIADELRVNRKVREGLARKADERSLKS